LPLLRSSKAKRRQETHGKAREEKEIDNGEQEGKFPEGKHLKKERMEKES